MYSSPNRTDEVKITCTNIKETIDDGGNAADGVNFVSLVRELRMTLGDDKIITVASQADMGKAQDENIKGLFEYIDMFNLMTYDYTVSNIEHSPVTAPNEPLYPSPQSKGSVSTTINGYLAQGIPAKKMSVGIAYYGHSWYVPEMTKESDWCQFGINTQIQGQCCGPFAKTYGAQYGEYSQMCGSYMYSEIQSAGFETCFDNVTQSAIGYDTAARVWISFQDSKTVNAIVNFAKCKGLRGAFASGISMDSMSGGGLFTYELTQEIAANFKNKTKKC